MTIKRNYSHLTDKLVVIQCSIRIDGYFENGHRVESAIEMIKVLIKLAQQGAKK